MIFVGIIIIITQIEIIKNILQTGILTNNDITICTIKSIGFLICMFSFVIIVLSLSAILMPDVGGPDTDMIFETLKAILFLSGLLFSVLGNQFIKLLKGAAPVANNGQSNNNTSSDNLRGVRSSRFNRWIVRLPL